MVVVLGTFQRVDYVFLVGVGGGVPHYTNYEKHVRLGDVVVSTPEANTNWMYTYCDVAEEKPDGNFCFETKSWGAPTYLIQDIAYQLKQQVEMKEILELYLKIIMSNRTCCRCLWF